MLLLTVFSEAACAIVVQPFLVGDELERLALAASRECVRALREAGNLQLDDAISLEILNGGRYYFVADAVQAELGVPCAKSSVRAHRYQDTNTGEWSLRVWDWLGLDVLARKQGPLLIGDTISTGTTLAGILSVALTEMENANNVRDIACITFAGSSFAAQSPKLLEIDERLAKHGKHLIIVFANGQVFHISIINFDVCQVF
jgi:hypoxanthine-guanine phosphoribosyltransferase